jgi:hypothetical protein
VRMRDAMGASCGTAGPGASDYRPKACRAKGLYKNRTRRTLVRKKVFADCLLPTKI